jgi:hypothetical protein
VQVAIAEAWIKTYIFMPDTMSIKLIAICNTVVFENNLISGYVVIFSK